MCWSSRKVLMSKIFIKFINYILEILQFIFSTVKFHNSAITTYMYLHIIMEELNNNNPLTMMANSWRRNNNRTNCDYQQNDAAAVRSRIVEYNVNMNYLPLSLRHHPRNTKFWETFRWTLFSILARIQRAPALNNRFHVHGQLLSHLHRWLYQTANSPLTTTLP